jgi:hypothetical protein
MQIQFRICLLAFAIALLSGCATGPKYGEVKQSIPALKQTEGRIFFYRSGNPFGSGIQPSVMLNGNKVGESTPGGFFFVDMNPGPMEIVLSTEVERKLTFTLSAGQVRYVRMSVGLGVIVYRVYPELVDESAGQSEIVDLSYTGDKLTSK